MSNNAKVREIFDGNEGILRLLPNLIPRPWGRAGRRLRLHPDDYYAFGTRRGEIKERWFSSVTAAINDVQSPPDEGMSYVQTGPGAQDKILFKDFVDTLGADLIGPELQEKYGTWPMYSKFFDFASPLFHHMHLDQEAASRVGRNGKPEAYYFPFQLNMYEGQFPHTYIGFSPEVTKEEVLERMKHYEDFDTRLTELSRAYRLQLGTGWYIPAGVLHAPGSYLTYEPQWNSDVNAIFENVTAGEVNSYGSLVAQCPEDKKRDWDYIMSLLDWEKNIDPNFREEYFRPPIVIEENEAYTDKWITYGNPYFSAKELTVMPGNSVRIADKAAYGCIIVQGHGEFGSYHDAEAVGMMRFGQATADEYFVSEKAAKSGVKIVNASKVEPLVILKHFGPNNTMTRQ